MCVWGGGGGIGKEWGLKSFVGSDIYFSCCSCSFSPVKISGFQVPKSLCFAKNSVTTAKPHFHGNQWIIHLLIPSLTASFKTGLSELCAR